MGRRLAGWGMVDSLGGYGHNYVGMGQNPTLPSSGYGYSRNDGLYEHSHGMGSLGHPSYGSNYASIYGLGDDPTPSPMAPSQAAEDQSWQSLVLNSGYTPYDALTTVRTNYSDPGYVTSDSVANAVQAALAAKGQAQSATAQVATKAAAKTTGFIGKITGLHIPIEVIAGGGVIAVGAAAYFLWPHKKGKRRR